MNNKALTLSLGMAILAVFFVNSYVESIEQEAKRKFGTEVMVLKAKRDIKEQETLLENAMGYELVPKKFLEPAADYVETREENDKTKDNLHRLVGSVAIVPLRKGEQITINKITPPGVRTGLAPQVAPGRRGFPIPVNDITGVAKLIKPGDRVDLIAILDMGGGKENKISKTILQDVVVLATGRNVTNNMARIVEADPYGGKDKIKPLTEDTSFSTVTLEVEPQQAQTLALIMANGEAAITLSLRNNDDTDRINIGAVTLTDILGADAARVQRGPAGGKR